MNLELINTVSVPYEMLWNRSETGQINIVQQFKFSVCIELLMKSHESGLKRLVGFYHENYLMV